jgi:hypothetical protein
LRSSVPPGGHDPLLGTTLLSKAKSPQHRGRCGLAERVRRSCHLMRLFLSRLRLLRRLGNWRRTVGQPERHRRFQLRRRLRLARGNFHYGRRQVVADESKHERLTARRALDQAISIFRRCVQLSLATKTFDCRHGLRFRQRPSRRSPRIVPRRFGLADGQAGNRAAASGCCH